MDRACPSRLRPRAPGYVMRPAVHPVSMHLSDQERADLIHATAVAEGHAIRMAGAALTPYAVAIQEIRAQRLKALFDRLLDEDPRNAVADEEAGRG